MMNKKEILKKVGGILTELNEQYQYLSQSPDNLNDLELELLSANAKFLSDHLSILLKINDSSTKAVSEKTEADDDISLPAAETPEPEEPVDENQDTGEIGSDWKFEMEKEPGLTFEFEEKKADELVDEPLSDDENRVIAETTTTKPTETVEDNSAFDVKAGEDTEEVKPLASMENDDDVYVKEVVISERTIAVPAEAASVVKPAPTINDLLSKTSTSQTLASQFHSRSQTDLKGMISMNDKLLFVRELFNGYSLAYSEALELLNRFDNFEAADNFLTHNYAPKNNWGQKQEVTDKFYEILKRRFSK